MTTTWIPGYMSSIEIGTDDLTVVANVLGLDLAPAVLPKAVFGQKYRNSTGGQISGSLSVAGHMTVEVLPLFLPMVESDESLDFVMYAGEEGGTIDGGSFTGKIRISSLSIPSSADGEWDWSLDAEFDGPVTFTPPAP